jgi:hypothetical protein
MPPLPKGRGTTLVVEGFLTTHLIFLNLTVGRRRPTLRIICIGLLYGMVIFDIPQGLIRFGGSMKGIDPYDMSIKNFLNPLTKYILRVTMYYVKGGIVWMFN